MYRSPRRLASAILPLGILVFTAAGRALAAPKPRPARDRQEESFRFIHITDTHLTATANIEPLERLVAEIGRMDPAPVFVVDTGDVTEAGRPEEFARFTEGIAGLAVPFYCAPGNHDVRWSPQGKEEFAHAFKRLYQSWDYGGCHFVILDSTIALEHWGHFDPAQLRWLDADLKRLKPKTPVFLFFHHWIGRSPRMVDNEEALLRLIQPYNVVAILVGHGHQNLQWKVNGIQCVMARALYDGGYDAVDVGSSDIRILRIRTADADRPPVVIADIPRYTGPTKWVNFLWDDPDLPVLARRRPLAELDIGKAGAHDSSVKAAYSVNGGPKQPMERDTRDTKSVSFRAQFDTKDLPDGAQTLRLYLTDPSGDVYERAETFTVERLQDHPKSHWDDAFKTDADAGIWGRPAFADGRLFFGAEDGRVYAVNAASGKRAWVVPTKGPVTATPAVAEGLVYVGSADHVLYAIEADSGRVRWRFDAGAPIFASAAVENGLVCVGTDRRICCVDAASGKPCWTQPAGGMFQSRAAAAGGVFYLGGWDNTLYALDAATGRPRWTAKMGRTKAGRGDLSFYFSPAISSPAVDTTSHRVFVCTDDGVLHAVNAATGKDDWTARAPAGGDALGYSSPLVAAGRVYVGGLGDRGDCYAFDAATGSLVWRCSTGAQNYDSSPVFAGRLLAIGSVAGKLSWIDPESGTVRYQYGLGPGWCFSTPVTDGRVTFATTMAGRAYAIELPGPQVAGRR